jgi:Secretion system C-terminal sorting domain
MTKIMKKHLLTIAGICVSATSLFAQLNSAQIWNLNRYVDPMPHNAINLAGITMQLTYNPNGVPLTGASSAPAGFPISLRITSNVTGNKTVCISSEKEGNDPWEDKERATFESDGTNDTTITVEESNNGSAFAYSGKILIQRGSNPNQYTFVQYRFLSNNWVLDSKLFHYLSNGRIDSVVNYKYTATDSTRGGVRTYYYSNGLDSVLDNTLQVSTNQFEVRGRFLVLQKENGKTKQWAIEQRQTTTGPFQRNGTITYSNGPASSLNESELESSFSIYPNPATTTVQLMTSQNLNVYTLTILNMNGQKVKEVQGSSTISISDLTNGLYFVQVTSDKGISTQKFIKQ